MLDREVVQEFLEREFKERKTKVPRAIPQKELTETFCKYVENDYYEWLMDNFKSFFNYGNPDWNWIKDRITAYSKE